MRSIGAGERRIWCPLKPPTQPTAQQKTSGFSLHRLLPLPFKSDTQPVPQDDTGRLALEPFLTLLLKTGTQPIVEQKPSDTTHLPFALLLALETYPEALPDDEPVDVFDTWFSIRPVRVLISFVLLLIVCMVDTSSLASEFSVSCRACKSSCSI